MSSLPAIPRVGVLGCRGFVGASIVRALEKSHRAIAVPLPRLDVDESDNDAIYAALETVSVVVNAAGSASPLASSDFELRQKNVRIPDLLQRICSVVGVQMLVHVSSAAVQSGTRMLDETLTTDGFSPYARTKIEAERLLLGRDSGTPVLVYRPTSVHGVERQLTRKVVRYFSTPGVPIVGTGAEQLPLAHVDSVAMVVEYLATQQSVPNERVFLHPWEGMSQARAFELLGGRSPLRLGQLAHTASAVALGRLDRIDRFGGIVRRAEGLLGLQEIDARNLADLGFEVAGSSERFAQMGADVRASLNR